jgi:hypothetical protein
MVLRQLFIACAVMFSINGFCSEVKQKFEKLYELQSVKSESRKTMDKSLDMLAAHFAVDNESRESFKSEVFEKWYAACKEAFAELYSQHFAETDVDEMIQYAESETGKKLAYTQQSLTLALMPVYQSIGMISTEVAVAIKK